MTYEVERLKQDITAVVNIESDQLGLLHAKNLAKRRVLAEQLERIRSARDLVTLRNELHAYLFVRDEKDLGA